MPGQDLAQASVDATLIPEAAHKFAQRALREHQRAERDVLKAVEHIVKSGQNLLKAYDLCEWGQWEAFFEMHFKLKADPNDGTRPLTLRTAQRYMQLARDWSQLIAEHPEGSRRNGKRLKHLRRSLARRKIAGPKRSQAKAQRARQVQAAKAQRAAPMAANAPAPARCGGHPGRSSAKHCAS